MIKTIEKLVLLILDLLIFTTLFLIYIIPFIIVTIYKTLLLFIANQIFKRKLILFDGLKICNFLTLRFDLDKITKTTNNNCNSNQPILAEPSQNNSRFIDESLACNVGALITYNGEILDLETIHNLFYSKFLK